MRESGRKERKQLKKEREMLRDDNFFETNGGCGKNGFCYIDLKDAPLSIRLFEETKIRLRLDYVIERTGENWVMFLIRIPKKQRSIFLDAMKQLKNRCLICDSHFGSYCEKFNQMMDEATESKA